MSSALAGAVKSKNVSRNWVSRMRVDVLFRADGNVHVHVSGCRADMIFRKFHK